MSTRPRKTPAATSTVVAATTRGPAAIVCGDVTRAMALRLAVVVREQFQRSERKSWLRWFRQGVAGLGWPAWGRWQEPVKQKIEQRVAELLADAEYTDRLAVFALSAMPDRAWDGAGSLFRFVCGCAGLQALLEIAAAR